MTQIINQDSSIGSLNSYENIINELNKCFQNALNLEAESPELAKSFYNQLINHENHHKLCEAGFSHISIGIIYHVYWAMFRISKEPKSQILHLLNILTQLKYINNSRTKFINLPLKIDIHYDTIIVWEMIRKISKNFNPRIYYISLKELKKVFPFNKYINRSLQKIYDQRCNFRMGWKLNDNPIKYSKYLYHRLNSKLNHKMEIKSNNLKIGRTLQKKTIAFIKCDSFFNFLFDISNLLNRSNLDFELNIEKKIDNVKIYEENQKFRKFERTTRKIKPSHNDRLNNEKIKEWYNNLDNELKNDILNWISDIKFTTNTNINSNNIIKNFDNILIKVKELVIQKNISILDLCNNFLISSLETELIKKSSGKKNTNLLLKIIDRINELGYWHEIISLEPYKFLGFLAAFIIECIAIKASNNDSNRKLKISKKYSLINMWINQCLCKIKDNSFKLKIKINFLWSKYCFFKALQDYKAAKKFIKIFYNYVNYVKMGNKINFSIDELNIEEKKQIYLQMIQEINQKYKNGNYKEIMDLIVLKKQDFTQLDLVENYQTYIYILDSFNKINIGKEQEYKEICQNIIILLKEYLLDLIVRRGSYPKLTSKIFKFFENLPKKERFLKDSKKFLYFCILLSLEHLEDEAITHSYSKKATCLYLIYEASAIICKEWIEIGFDNNMSKVLHNDMNFLFDYILKDLGKIPFQPKLSERKMVDQSKISLCELLKTYNNIFNEKIDPFIRSKNLWEIEMIKHNLLYEKNKEKIQKILKKITINPENVEFFNNFINFLLNSNFDELHNSQKDILFYAFKFANYFFSSATNWNLENLSKIFNIQKQLDNLENYSDVIKIFFGIIGVINISSTDKEALCNAFKRKFYLIPSKSKNIELSSNIYYLTVKYLDLNYNNIFFEIENNQYDLLLKAISYSPSLYENYKVAYLWIELANELYIRIIKISGTWLNEQYRNLEIYRFFIACTIIYIYEPNSIRSRVTFSKLFKICLDEIVLSNLQTIFPKIFEIENLIFRMLLKTGFDYDNLIYLPIYLSKVYLNQKKPSKAFLKKILQLMNSSYDKSSSIPKDDQAMIKYNYIKFLYESKIFLSGNSKISEEILYLLKDSKLGNFIFHGFDNNCNTQEFISLINSNLTNELLSLYFFAPLSMHRALYLASIIYISLYKFNDAISTILRLFNYEPSFRDPLRVKLHKVKSTYANYHHTFNYFLQLSNALSYDKSFNFLIPACEILLKTSKLSIFPNYMLDKISVSFHTLFLNYADLLIQRITLENKLCQTPGCNNYCNCNQIENSLPSYKSLLFKSCSSTKIDQISSFNYDENYLKMNAVITSNLNELLIEVQKIFDIVNSIKSCSFVDDNSNIFLPIASYIYCMKYQKLIDTNRIICFMKSFIVSIIDSRCIYCFDIILNQLISNHFLSLKGEKK